MVLYVVRHGETDWNVEGRLQGQQDIPLNARGRDQAEAVGRTLKRLGIGGDAVFMASPLGRARETMTRLRLAMGLDADGYALDDRLKELTFGDWEGLTWPQVMVRDGEAARRRDADKWNFVPPSGESYAMLADRVMPLIDSLPGTAVIVSHGGVARVLLSRLAGVKVDVASRMAIAQGRALLFDGTGYRWI